MNAENASSPENMGTKNRDDPPPLSCGNDSHCLFSYQCDIRAVPFIGALDTITIQFAKENWVKVVNVNHSDGEPVRLNFIQSEMDAMRTEKQYIQSGSSNVLHF